MKVGVRQEFALSPLLFTMVMDVLTEDGKDGSLMEFLCGESLTEAMGNYGR